jgi:hypothetical protein
MVWVVREDILCALADSCSHGGLRAYGCVYLDDA